MVSTLKHRLKNTLTVAKCSVMQSTPYCKKLIEKKKLKLSGDYDYSDYRRLQVA